MAEFIQAVGGVKELTALLAQSFGKLLNGTDDVFVHACLKALGDNQSDFYDLIEYVREKLNTGYWRDVSEFWRRSYSLLRLSCVLSCLSSPNPEGNYDVEKIMWLLDDALILGHSDDLCDLLTCLASLANSFLTRCSPKSFPTCYSDVDSAPPALRSFTFPGEVISELSRVHQPSISEFTNILKVGIPVIVTGAMTHWPACNVNSDRYWSPAYFSKTAGYRTVPIEIGSAYTDESWGQRLLTINQFFETFVVNPVPAQPLGYLAQHQILLQIPELAKDIDIPDYCFTGAPDTDSFETTVDSNVWIGPVNTVSPLHHDGDRANVLCQLVGKKYVKLYSADQTEHIYPHVGNSMLSNTSQIDVASQEPNFCRFPKFKEARGFHGILRAGEMLFIPPRCWHYVRSLTASISMNFWWDVDTKFIPLWPTNYQF